MEFVYGNCIITSENAKEVKQLVVDEQKKVEKITKKINQMLSQKGPANMNFIRNSVIDNILYYYDQTEDKPTIGIRKSDKGVYYYKISYGIKSENIEKELAKRLMELVILPNNNSVVVNRQTKTSKVYGFIRTDENNEMYGSYFSSIFTELFSEFILSDNSFEDVLSEFVKKKKENLLVALLVIAGRNDYEDEVELDEIFTHGLADTMVEDSEHKSEPLNLLIYSYLTDSSLIEFDFNKIMGEGKWKVLLDVFEEFKFGNYDNFSKALNTVKFYTDKRIKRKYQNAVKRLGKSKIPDLTNKARLVAKILN